MINFASLFNQFRMGGSNSSINDLIETPGITVGRLLDEDSFVNEFKSGNNKVSQFMKYDKYQSLVEYITKVGPQDDRKRSYKYPMVASDVLSSDSQAPIEFFFPESPLFISQEISQEKNDQPEEQANVEEPDAKVTSVDSIQEPEDEAEAAQQPESGKTQDDTEGQQESELTAEQNPSKIEEEKESPTKEVKIIKKEVEPLRDQLFSYYEGEINYTLAGYVSKVFGSFLVKKPAVVLKYLLDEARFKCLLNHIESRSVSQLVFKMMTHESTECLEERKASFDSMLEMVSKTGEVYVLSNLSAAICEIIEKISTALKGNGNEYANQLSSLYFKPDIITMVITNVMADDENVSVYNSPILSTYLTNVPLVLPENDQLVEDLKLLLLSFLRKALQKLQVTRGTRATLGFGRVKIVEIMSFVLKQNVLDCQNLAADEKQFFPTLFSLCNNYQFNNVMHNQVVRIIDIAFSQNETSPFLLSLLNNEVLMKFLTDQTNEDMKIRAGEHTQKNRKGYIGHIVQICEKVLEYSSKNEEIKKFSDKPEFEYLLENLVNKEMYENRKNLSGYGMNKKGKNCILFSKEDVIQEHLKFLTQSPSPVYEAESEPVNIDHPDMVESEHQQIEGSPSLSDLIDGGVIEENNEQKQVNNDTEFWKKHLSYDIDDLMNDL